jgi:hypothetical protein
MQAPIKIAVQEAFDTVSNDTKFVRLTTITTIIHSIAFLLYVSFNIYRLIAKAEGDESNFSALLNSLADIFTISNMSRILIAIALILLI